MMSFYLKMKPPTITAQEHKVGVKNGKPYLYDPPELKEAKSMIMAHLNKYKRFEPYDEPVILFVIWLFQSDRHKNGEWKATKPDTDNLQKLLKDCMTQTGFWKDDALVVRETVEKRWVDMKHAPGIQISIMTAKEFDGLLEVEYGTTQKRP